MMERGRLLPVRGSINVSGQQMTALASCFSSADHTHHATHLRLTYKQAASMLLLDLHFRACMRNAASLSK